MALKFASENLRYDPDIVAAALNNSFMYPSISGKPLKYIGDEYKSNYDLVFGS